MRVILPKDDGFFNKALHIVKIVLDGEYIPELRAWDIPDDTDPALLAAYSIHRIAGEQEQGSLFEEES